MIWAAHGSSLPSVWQAPATTTAGNNTARMRMEAMAVGCRAGRGRSSGAYRSVPRFTRAGADFGAVGSAMRLGVLALVTVGCKQILGTGVIATAPDGRVTAPDLLHGTSTITW